MINQNKEKINGAVVRNRFRLVWEQRKIVKVFVKYWKYLQYHIRTISCSEKEITDEKKANTELFKFYKTLSEPKINVSNALIQDYLKYIEIPKLTNEQPQKCEEVINEEEINS